MFRYVSCFLICLLLSGACNHKNESGSSSARLTDFRGLPPELEGCSCYFSSSEKNFKNERYIFASDLDSTAYVIVNGKQVILKLISSTREPDAADEREYQETYSNGLYTVFITIRFKEHTGDEVWWNTGELQLFFKGIGVETRSFMGECGC